MAHNKQFNSQPTVAGTGFKPVLLLNVTDISNLSQASHIADICYVSKILTVGSEPVISFLNRANSFSGICPFCIFVTNTIYAMEIDMLKLVVLARNHRFFKVQDFTYIH